MNLSYEKFCQILAKQIQSLNVRTFVSEFVCLVRCLECTVEYVKSFNKFHLVDNSTWSGSPCLENYFYCKHPVLLNSSSDISRCVLIMTDVFVALRFRHSELKVLTLSTRRNIQEMQSSLWMGLATVDLKELN